MKRLYVSDLDGTLLTSKEKISDYSVKVLNSMIEKGLNFTFATARSGNSALSAVEGLKLKLPVILYNGALVYDLEKKEIIYSASLSQKEIEKIIEIAKSSEAYPMVHSYKKEENADKICWIVGDESFGQQRYLQRRRGDVRLRPVKTFEEIFSDEVFYFVCTGSKTWVDELAKKLSVIESLRIYTYKEKYRDDEYWLECMSKRANKANGVLAIKEKYGFDCVTCFGDEVNDEDMFRISDSSFAVKNAVKQLKDVATGIIAYAEEDAVAKFIDEKFKVD